MKKLVKWCCLCLTICFLALGFLYRGMARANEGVKFRTSGAYIGNRYVELDSKLSGVIGGNEKKVESYNQGGTIFFILSGVAGVATIAAFVKDRSSK